MNNETATRAWIAKLPIALTVACLRPQINVNENSDMNGRPKTCEVGGSTRTRISSQHGKHGMRTFDNFSPLLDAVQDRLTTECSDAIHVEADRRSRLWPQAIGAELRQKRDELAPSEPAYAAVTDVMCDRIGHAIMSVIISGDTNDKTAKRIEDLQKSIARAEKIVADAKNDAETATAERKLAALRDELAEFEEGAGDGDKHKNLLALGGEFDVLVKLCIQAMHDLVEEQKNRKDKKDAKEGKNEEATILAIDRLVKAKCKTLQGSLTEAASNGGKTVRLYRLLFGNMATTDYVSESRATLCRSHSFSVNADSSHIDQLTANDDLAYDFSKGKKGAGLMSEAEYATYTMFEFTSWNVRQFAKNLLAECPTFGPKEIGIVLEEVAAWLVRTASFGGKGSRESRAPAYGGADTVVVTTTLDQPVTPAAAFIRPIPLSADMRGLAEARLADELANYDAGYGPPAARAALPLDRVNMKDSPISKVALPLNLKDLQAWASAAVVSRPYAPVNGKTHHATPGQA
jgi:hypothetical protein